MCGRFVIISAPDVIRALLGYLAQPNFPPRHNIAPTQPIPIVRHAEGARQFALVRWGLLPGWVKDPKTFSLVINARGESVNEKPAFRNAMKYRRCLIPADGFYEWREEEGGKRPYYISLREGGPFAFAGLWESWSGPNGEEMQTAAIVTTSANATLAKLHHRMPVILDPKDYECWLNHRDANAREATQLIKPLPDDALQMWEVSSAVNRVVNDSADLLAPVTPGQPLVQEQKPRKEKPKDDRQGMLF